MHPTFRRLLRRALIAPLFLLLLASFVLVALLVFQQYAQATTCIFGTDIANGYCRGYLTSGTTWTVPGDWNPINNTIEVIGGGGGAHNITTQFEGSGGGGGGAYSKISNLSLTPGSSVAYAVGAGGGADTNGGDTYFCNSASNCASIAGSAVVVGAKGGETGGGGGGAGAAGGNPALGVGTIRYAGGYGGEGDDGSADGGGGGGGAGGGRGSGKHGGNESGNNGGQGGASGDGALGGAGGVDDADEPGAAGSAGTGWDATHGAGGGGGGGGDTGTGGDGGLYGGGAGGGGENSSGNATGAHGIIVITYMPPVNGVHLKASGGTRVAKTTTQTLTAYGECRRVTNDSAVGDSVYIPTNTAEEWHSFRDHPPAGVTVSPCIQIAYKSSSTSQSGTITVPADVVAGDIMVLLSHVKNGEGGPVGFTSLGGYGAYKYPNSYRATLNYKIATGDEAGTTIPVRSGDGPKHVLAVFSAPGATSVTVGARDSDGDLSGKPGSIFVPSSAGTPPLIIIHAFAGRLLNNPYGVRYSTPPYPTPQGQIDLGSPASARITYSIYNSAGLVPDAGARLNDMGTASASFVAYLEVQ